MKVVQRTRAFEDLTPLAGIELLTVQPKQEIAIKK